MKNKTMNEYIIYESELPWWFFLIRPFDTDGMIMANYGMLYYATPPKQYIKYIKNRYPELVNKKI